MKTSRWRVVFNADMHRYGTSKVDKYIKRWNYYYRRCQYAKAVWHFMLLKHGAKHGIEIDYPVKIGEGLFFAHPYGITINDKCIIGINCNIHKGVTIGQENRGKRLGTPVIGDNVWIGMNATIVGNIKIGNDVLIAPNTYLNCDVPSHSVVLGNPARIISRDNATKEYINNVVGE